VLDDDDDCCRFDEEILKDDGVDVDVDDRRVILQLMYIFVCYIFFYCRLLLLMLKRVAFPICL
jgi:hypothetical protein